MSNIDGIGDNMTDELDQKILDALQLDARVSVSQLARRMKVARTTIQTRIDRMEATGVILGYSVRLGRAAGPRMIRAIVLVQVETRATPTVLHRLKSMPAVELAFTTSGRFDLVLQLAATTTEALDVALDHIGEAKGVKSSESLIQLTTKIDRR